MNQIICSILTFPLPWSGLIDKGRIGVRLIQNRRGGRTMKNREKLLGEVFELALQNDMRYFG
jgi:hypothetical protein